MSTTFRTLASSLFLGVILLQFPLFKTRCRTGVCESPLHVIASQLSQSFPVPPDVMRYVVYPGALAQNLLHPDTKPFPDWDTLLEYYKLNGTYEQTPELTYRVDIMAGSYLVVAHAFQNLLKSGRMGVIGFFLLGWGIYREQPFVEGIHSGSSGKPFLTPWFFIALSLVVLGMGLDLTKLFPTKPKSQRTKSAKKKD